MQMRSIESPMIAQTSLARAWDSLSTQCCWGQLPEEILHILGLALYLDCKQCLM